MRYFTDLVQSAPEGIDAAAVFGLALNHHIWAGFCVWQGAPSAAQLNIHLLRQKLNYPKLFSFSLLAMLFRGVVSIIEGFRFRYFRSFFLSQGVDAVGVWNGQKIPYSTVVEAAESLGLAVWYFENGSLPGTTTVDSVGVNATSSLSRCPADYPVDNLACPIVESKEPLHILVPLQVESDTQVVLHSPWIKSNRQLIESICVASDSLSRELKCVVREHPLARSKVDRKNLPEWVVFDNETPLSLQLNQSDLVVTMNSTVGLEAVQLGKPVIVAAAALYGIRDVVKRVGNQTQLTDALRDIASGGWRPTRARAFISHLVGHYCVVGDWRNLGKEKPVHCRRVWKRLVG